MKKLFFALLGMLFVPNIALCQNMFQQVESLDYNKIPNGYRIFSLPLEIYKTKGIQKNSQVDIYATYSKKEKINAVLAEIKDIQKSETANTLPFVLKTDKDEEFITVLLLQNVKVFYSPAIPVTHPLDYPEAGVEMKYSDALAMPGLSSVTDTKKTVFEARQNLLARTVVIRLLLTPEEAQLAAHAVATDMKLSLVIRNSADTEKKSLTPINIDSFSKEKENKPITPITLNKPDLFQRN